MPLPARSGAAGSGLAADRFRCAPRIVQEFGRRSAKVLDERICPGLRQAQPLGSLRACVVLHSNASLRVRKADMTEHDFRSRILFSAWMCVASVVALFVAWTGRYVLLLLLGGVVGALLLSVPTSWLETKLRIRRVLALALVLVAVVAVLAGVVVLRGPALAQQLSTLQEVLPESARQILARLNADSWGQWVIAHLVSSAGSPDAVSAAVSGIRGVLSVTTLTVAGSIIVLFSSIFLAAEPDFYLRGLRLLTPAEHRATLDRCLAQAKANLQAWLVAKLLSMVLIGVMVALGLWALRVPLPGTLGIIAGLLTFIPNVGPIVSVVPAALLAFAISPTRGVLTLALFGLVHFLEGNVITPLAERSIVRLPPALTLAVQLLLATITGALGLAMAAPLTAVGLGILQGLMAAESKSRTQIEDLDMLPESTEVHSML